jgi:ketosteroid isomerase-like protein
MTQRDQVDALAAAFVDALDAGDADAMLDLVHPDYEFFSRLASVEGRAYRGREGFLDYLRDIADGFSGARWELVEIVGSRGDVAVVVFRFTAVGRESRAPVDMTGPQVWTFRDGLVWRNEVYRSRAEALEAAGLHE